MLGALLWCIVTIDLINDIKTTIKEHAELSEDDLRKTGKELQNVIKKKDIGFIPQGKHGGRYANEADRPLVMPTCNIPAWSLGFFGDDSTVALSGPRAARLVRPMQAVLKVFDDWAEKHQIKISPKSNLQLFIHYKWETGALAPGPDAREFDEEKVGDDDDDELEEDVDQEDFDDDDDDDGEEKKESVDEHICSSLWSVCLQRMYVIYLFNG